MPLQSFMPYAYQYANVTPQNYVMQLHLSSLQRIQVKTGTTFYEKLCQYDNRCKECLRRFHVTFLKRKITPDRKTFSHLSNHIGILITLLKPWLTGFDGFKLNYLTYFEKCNGIEVGHVRQVKINSELMSA